MANDIDIDWERYNKNMDLLDEESKIKERERQARELEQYLANQPPPKMFYMQVGFPTEYIDADVSPSQKLMLGDPTSLITLMNDHGIHVMQYPPSKNPKVTGIVIGGEWTEVTVEWELE